ncbi:MAG: hypothetical protein WKG07_01715 [Hymenobacter sp.]
MLTSRLPLLTALALAGGLTACGNKDNAAEQTTAATEQTPSHRAHRRQRGSYPRARRRGGCYYARRYA